MYEGRGAAGNHHPRPRLSTVLTDRRLGHHQHFLLWLARGPASSRPQGKVAPLPKPKGICVCRAQRPGGSQDPRVEAPACGRDPRLGRVPCA